MKGRKAASECRGIYSQEEEEEEENLGMGWRFWSKIGICCEGGFGRRFVFGGVGGGGKAGRWRCSSERGGFLWGRIGGVEWGWSEGREGRGSLI